jgi:DNA-binding NtrC family response regulator
MRNEDLKIFLVDDDIFSLNLYSQHIINLGYRDVYLFEKGMDSLESLEENPTIIFLDHNMDDMLGLDVLKEIKRINPGIYVVMISAQENVQVAIDAVKYGVFEYIIKTEDVPAKMEAIIHRIVEIQKEFNKSRSN